MSTPIFTLHLRMLDIDTEIKTLVRLPVLFGRFDTETGFKPEIDLEDHDGAEAGVSRRHLILYPDPETFMIKDLNSTNGSFINGVQLKPNIIYPLRSGDELVVGHLRMRVMYALFQDGREKVIPAVQPIEDAATRHGAQSHSPITATVVVPAVAVQDSTQTQEAPIHEPDSKFDTPARRVTPLAKREVYTADQKIAISLLRKIAINKEISENMMAYLAARATQEAEWTVNRRLAVLKTACEYGYVARDNAELMQEQRRKNELRFGLRE